MPLFGKKVVLSKSDLSAKLTELGQKNDQFTLTGSPETDFIVERKIVDASEYGISGADEMKKSYKGVLLLDEQKHEARYNEEMTETSRSAPVSPRNVGFRRRKSFSAAKFSQKKVRQRVGGNKRRLPYKI